MQEQAGEQYLTSPIWHWEEFYSPTVEAVRDDEWEADAYWEGIDAGICDIDDWGPVVRRAATTLLDTATVDVVVVVGHEATAVREALSGLAVSVRTNPEYAAGQSTSVRTGVEAARERDWEAAVFALGDMPFVDSETVDALIERSGNGDESVVAPAYDGRRGNPVLFESRQYEALRAVTGDEGGRRLLEQRADVALVETDDPGVVQDIDVQSDLSGSGRTR